jgi:hypothetical protein
MAIPAKKPAVTQDGMRREKLPNPEVMLESKLQYNSIM